MLSKSSNLTYKIFITTIKRSRRSGGTVILEEEENVGKKASNRKEDSLIVCRYDSNYKVIKTLSYLVIIFLIRFLCRNL